MEPFNFVYGRVHRRFMTCLSRRSEAVKSAARLFFAHSVFTLSRAHSQMISAKRRRRCYVVFFVKLEKKHASSANDFYHFSSFVDFHLCDVRCSIFTFEELLTQEISEITSLKFLFLNEFTYLSILIFFCAYNYLFTLFFRKFFL